MMESLPDFHFSSVLLLFVSSPSAWTISYPIIHQVWQSMTGDWRQPVRRQSRRAVVAVAACACAIVAVAVWSSSSGLRSSVSTVLLLQDDRSVAQAMQAALRDEGKVEQLQGEVKTLDKIRDDMMRQLAHQPTSHLQGPGRIKQLGEIMRNTEDLQARLDDAAKAEKSLLVQSEEVIDGGCKDHHAEMCGSQSCCSFWAKAGQCLRGSSHQEWMTVRCSLSCSSCRAAPATAAAPAAVGLGSVSAAGSAATPSKRVAATTGLSWPKKAAAKTGLSWPQGASNAVAAAARAAKKLSIKKKLSQRKSALAWPPRGGKRKVEVSMVLHGLDTSSLSKEELEKALHRAISALSPDGLSAQDVKLDAVQRIIGHAALLKADTPTRRRWGQSWAH